MAAFLGICSGVISCLSGAVGFMSAFKKTQATQIVGSGSGTGFFHYVSYTNLGGRSIPVFMGPNYLNTQITRLIQKQTPDIQSKMGEIIESLQDAAEFGSYAIEDHRSVNTVAYNDRIGKLFFYIYGFKGIPKSDFGYIIECEDVKVEVDFKLPRDWIIVSKMKSSFMKCTMNQEIQYLPDKSLSMNQIVEAISMAMAPAVLGLIKVPKAFMVCMESILRTQIENPDNKIVPCPNPELAQQALGNFQQMVAAQQQSVQAAQDGLDKMSGGVDKIGAAMQEAKKNSAERVHRHRYGFGIPETHRHRHHTLPAGRF